MSGARHLWFLATRVPRFFSGAALHRWGLEAVAAREYAAAERLFEAGAERYRSELAVEPLARLRAHQLIGRVRAGSHLDGESEAILEVERVLSRLERIESLDPPFELIEAHALLATWLARPVEAASADTERLAA